MKSNIALVTGASSGLGQATAERLATAGYKVFLKSDAPCHPTIKAALATARLMNGIRAERQRQLTGSIERRGICVSVEKPTAAC